MGMQEHPVGRLMKMRAEVDGWGLLSREDGLPSVKKPARRVFGEGWSIYPPYPVGVPLDLPASLIALMQMERKPGKV